MKPALRRISVTVVEPHAGRFGWQLLEEITDGQWDVLAQSRRNFDRYAEAMAAGLAQLQGMVADLAVGPRQVSAETNAKANTTKAASSRAGRDAKVDAAPGAASDDDSKPAGSGKLFGFGPLR